MYVIEGGDARKKAVVSHIDFETKVYSSRNLSETMNFRKTAY